MNAPVSGLYAVRSLSDLIDEMGRDLERLNRAIEQFGGHLDEWSDNLDRAHPSGRAVVNGAASVFALRASIPFAGDN